MAILNEDLVFGRDAPKSVRDAFVGGVARRLLLPARTGLFKFTDAAVPAAELLGAISPWWISAVPIEPRDLDLDHLIAAAADAGLSVADHARRCFAVMFQWNSLASASAAHTRVVSLVISQPVFGFYGRSQRMPDDRLPLAARGPLPRSPALPGGSAQLWIPNLSSRHFVHVTYRLLPR
jgi:hypothetical protein